MGIARIARALAVGLTLGAAAAGEVASEGPAPAAASLDEIIIVYKTHPAGSACP